MKIDGSRIIENQVIHARSTKSAETTLEAGMHELTVDYFNNTGEAVLDIEIEGPDVPRGDITKYTSLTEDVQPVAPKEPFRVEEKLVVEGRKLFATTGCASCHDLREENEKKPIASALKAPKAAGMDLGEGCLSERPKGKAANFGLTTRQREVIRAALRAKPQAEDDAKKNNNLIVQHLTTFNCVACHARDGIGGVETARDDYFLTTIKEMGDEGRVPPPLNGVGGKINMAWMRNIVDKGVKSRPYMLTRMPGFGIRNVKPLIETFETVDVLPPKPLPKFDEPAYRVKDQGRLLVGSKGFSCIKCHTFDKFKAEGIQSIDMTTMTKRLRPEWFVRYVRDPMTFRPGTRMPSAWPKEGKSYLPTVFDGDSDKQIAAVWTYLEGGAKAAPPMGVGGDPIELVATTEPVIYRNFIEGAGPRTIGVGYPEKLNLAFDAAELRLATIWKGPFIDAHVHWSSRGGGLAPPLGDHVIPQSTGVAFAELKTADDDWPTDSARTRGGYQFLGYRLDKSGRPTFEYRIAGARIDDKPEPVSSSPNPHLRRTFTFEAAKPPKNLWLRIAAAPKIEETGDGCYTIDGSWKVRLDGATPIVRQADKLKELLAPVMFDGKKAQIVETFDW